MRSEAILLLLLVAPCVVQSAMLKKPGLLATDNVKNDAKCLADTLKLLNATALKTADAKCTVVCVADSLTQKGNCTTSPECKAYESACKSPATNGWGWWCVIDTNLMGSKISDPSCLAASCSGTTQGTFVVQEGKQSVSVGPASVTVTCTKNGPPTWFIIVMVLVGLLVVVGIGCCFRRRQGYAKV
jgi:hypothetical protein